MSTSPLLMNTQVISCRGKRLPLIWGFIASAIFCAAVRAAPSAYPYNTMTGAEVVSKLLAQTETDGDYRQRDLAYYYVAGIKDGTQGREWCFTGTLKPDELTYEIAFALKRNLSKAVLKGDAAPLILEELRTRYPCQPNSGKRQ